MQNMSHYDECRAALARKSYSAIQQIIMDRFNTLNRNYVLPTGLPKDFVENCDEYVRSTRYDNIVTRKQRERFPGYPAAQVLANNPEHFDVLAEGPTFANFENLLRSLRACGVSILVPVGPANVMENTKEGTKVSEKFYDYLMCAHPISAREFLDEALRTKREYRNNLKNNFKFYRYQHNLHGTFYIMHVVSWPDFGLPEFTEDDRYIFNLLTRDGNNTCWHCSAGVGRSVAMLAAKLFCQLEFSENEQTNVENFLGVIEKIKKVKPLAGGARGGIEQLLLGYALAKDAKQAPLPDARQAPLPPRVLSQRRSKSSSDFFQEGQTATVPQTPNNPVSDRSKLTSSL